MTQGSLSMWSKGTDFKEGKILACLCVDVMSIRKRLLCHPAIINPTKRDEMKMRCFNSHQQALGTCCGIGEI